MTEPGEWGHGTQTSQYSMHAVGYLTIITDMQESYKRKQVTGAGDELGDRSGDGMGDGNI